MKKILILTDFSGNAFRAAKYAAYLFEGEPCDFYLLHARERNIPGNGEPEDEKMERLLKKLRSRNKNEKHEYSGDISNDTLVNAVGWTVMARGIHYIFTGVKGITAAKRVFMGSNTVNIINKIDFCPVIAVPPDMVFSPPDMILFPTDFKRPYEEFELWPLVEIARIRKSEIVIMHVIEEEKLSNTQSGNRKKLRELLKDIRHTEEEVVKNSTITSLISHYAEKEPVSMVAMINNRYGFWERFFREAIVNKVIFRVSVPFLVIPETS